MSKRQEVGDTELLGPYVFRGARLSGLKLCSTRDRVSSALEPAAILGSLAVLQAELLQRRALYAERCTLAVSGSISGAPQTAPAVRECSTIHHRLQHKQSPLSSRDESRCTGHVTGVTPSLPALWTDLPSCENVIVATALRHTEAIADLTHYARRHLTCNGNDWPCHIAPLCQHICIGHVVPRFFVRLNEATDS